MERHFLGVEFWSTILVTAGLVVWGYRYGGRHVTDELLQGDRSTIYSTFASVYASLFGFLIAAVAFVIGLANKEARLALLRNSPHYKTLRKAFMSAIWWLGFATLVSLVSLLVERSQYPHFWLICLLAFCTELVTLRVANCVLLLGLVIDVITKPTKRPGDS